MKLIARPVSHSVTLGLTLLLAMAAFAAGGEPIVAVTGSAPKSVRHGAKLMANVRFAVPKGFHIYSPTFKGIGIPVTFALRGAPAGFKLLSPVAPKGGELKGNVTMELPIAIPAAAKGRAAFSVLVTYQQCNERICLPPAKATLNLNTVVK